MKFMLRSPKPPVLIDSGKRLICITGNTKKDIDLKEEEDFTEKSSYHAIDSTGESFSYLTEADVLTPLIVKEQNTKKAIIELYNLRRPKGSAEYTVNSLSNNKYLQIFSEIAALVLAQQHG